MDFIEGTERPSGLNSPQLFNEYPSLSSFCSRQEVVGGKADDYITLEYIADA